MSFIQLFITFLVGLIGVGVGWGALHNQVKVNTEDISKLQNIWEKLRGNTTGGQPIYVVRNEYEETTNELKDEICKVKKIVEKQTKDLSKVQNFARWMLIEKEGLSLIEVNKILNGE